MEKSTQNWSSSKSVFVQSIQLIGMHWKAVLGSIFSLFVLGLLFQYLLQTISSAGGSSLTVGQLTAIRNSFYGLILLYQFSVTILMIRKLQAPSLSAWSIIFSAKFWKQSFFGLLLWLITVVFIGFSSLLLIVPGIYFSVWLALALYVLVFEDTSLFDSFKKGVQLTKGYAWQVFGRILYLLFLSVVIAFISIVPQTGVLVSSLLTLFVSYAAIFFLGLTYTEIIEKKRNGIRSIQISTGRKVGYVFISVLLFGSLALFSSISNFVGEVTQTGLELQAAAELQQ